MSRPYRMKVRAEASEETGQRILEVAQKLFGELLYDQVSLQEVANQAGVSVQTVFRRFGSKEQFVCSHNGLHLETNQREARSGPCG